MVFDAAGFAFLDACRGGETAGETATAALTADPDANVGGRLAELIAFGAFRSATPTP